MPKMEKMKTKKEIKGGNKKMDKEYLGEHLNEEQKNLLSKINIKEISLMYERIDRLEYILYDRYNVCICGKKKHSKKCLEHRKMCREQKKQYHNKLKGKLEKREYKCLEKSLKNIKDVIAILIDSKGFLGMMDIEFSITIFKELDIKPNEFKIRNLRASDLGIVTENLK